MVLPAVARKKGLDDQYQTTDGTPKPRKPDPERPEPVRFLLWHLGTIQLMTFSQAPGTFGYDYSKYRPPRDGEPIPNGIELDEFGNKKPIVDTNPPVEKSKEDPLSIIATMIDDQRPIATTKQHSYIPRPSPPPSPPPFSHYTSYGPLEAKPVPSQNHHPMEEEEDRSGGCCKCVIM